jgi:hypothetical protein
MDDNATIPLGERMFQFDTKVFMALYLSIYGKTHLAYRRYNAQALSNGIMPSTLCNRKSYGSKVRLLPKVDVLGAITTTPCLQCLRIAMSDVPRFIWEITQ